jgi:hypothetical protein
MTLLERAASSEVVDDIVLPFAVESLSTRGRLVRLGPAISCSNVMIIPKLCRGWWRKL